jgi:O-methyltransferase involved in polyketide biosynthesis
MEEGKPNFKAEIGAVIRSVETEKPESERLCYDPFAKDFVGVGKRIAGRIPPLRKLALWHLEKLCDSQRLFQFS